MSQTVSSFLSSLSTPYCHPDLTDRDVLTLMNKYKGLTIKPDKFRFNAGREYELLHLQGTIPIPFKGITYNIPMSFWLLDTHPFHAPMVFINPTADMQVKVSKNVDAAGKIYLPYLNEWKYPGSNLLGLAQTCIDIFSSQPPVYAKPTESEPCKQSQEVISPFPSPVPPPYNQSDFTKRNVQALLNKYKGLKVKHDKFMFSDGSERDLVHIQGTIPAPYKGIYYNIPMSFWLLDTHPFHAPLVFVKPTADMQVNVSKNVDAAGKIYLPYLHSWSHPGSDMLGLAQTCIETFSKQPPVHAKKKKSEKLKKNVPKEDQEIPEINLALTREALEVSPKNSVPCPECPVCYEEMKPPCKILQCRAGHLICQVCSDRPEITRCPVCKQEMIGMATGMENYLRDISG